MASNAVHSQDATVHDGVRRIARGTAVLALRALRVLAYGVLAVFRPVMIPLLTWVAVGGLAVWFVFVPIAHDPDFPTFKVLAMSAGCGAGAILYYTAMEFLMPGSLGEGP